MRITKLFLLFLLSGALSIQVSAQTKAATESAMDRFLRYVKIDTQSAEDRTRAVSTKKQLDLARLLEKELNAFGVQNVRISSWASYTEWFPGICADNSKVPTIGFIAHMDTSPAVTGANVNRSFTRIIRAAISFCRMIRRR